MSDSKRLTLFKVGLRVRAVEKALDVLSRQASIGTVNLAGDACEAMVGAASALDDGDMLFGTRRDLPAAIARNVSLETVFHQVFGTNADPSLGRGMPGTINHHGENVALSDGSPAMHLVHAAGYGHAARLKGAPNIALGLFGSAAQANGELHAALNFAAVNRCNTVFVARGALAGELRLSEIAHAWGIRAVLVPGDDSLAVHDAVAEARLVALGGGGATVVDARLDGPVRPVNAQALQEARELSMESEGAMKEAVAAEVQAALKAAKTAATVSPHTLVNETFSDRPWFL